MSAITCPRCASSLPATPEGATPGPCATCGAAPRARSASGARRPGSRPYEAPPKTNPTFLLLVAGTIMVPVLIAVIVVVAAVIIKRAGGAPPAGVGLDTSHMPTLVDASGAPSFTAPALRGAGVGRHAIAFR